MATPPDPLGAKIPEWANLPRATAPPSKTKGATEDFERMVLGNLVDEMMKTVKEGAFGSEKNAKMWRSFMSNAIADKLALDGGLGLNGQVNQVLEAYGKSANNSGLEAGKEDRK